MAQETKYHRLDDSRPVNEDEKVMRYVSLHSHTTYSYMDGFEVPAEHAYRVADLGMNALALTEHGNVSSHVKHEQACAKYGIKPIFGLEAYTAPPKSMRKWHLTLLAQNVTGYKNLMRMTTRSWAEQFYRWPTVTGDILGDHHEGIIALSGCQDSHLACQLLGGKGIEDPSKAKAERLLRIYKRMFGDRYYLEVQRFPDLERTCELNAQYAEWSERFDIPLAATSDVHYPYPEQSDIQRILHSAGRGKHVDEADWEYKIKLTYPTSDEEIIQNVQDTGMTREQAESAVYNTAEIAERCNVELPKMDLLKYPIGKDDFKPWKE